MFTRLFFYRGFGFVTFVEADSVTNVLSGMHDHQLDDKKVGRETVGVALIPTMIISLWCRLILSLPP